MGISIGNRLLGTTGLSPGGGLSRGGGLSFGGFSPSAALNLNFLSGVLDPRITFSRPSLATYFDSTGKLTYAPNNLFVRSQEFATASWTKASAGVALSPTATDNFGVAPDGTQTASRVQFSLNGGTASADQSTLRQSNIFPVVPITSIVSFYVRSTDGVSSYNMLLFGSGSASQAITITGSWTRISYLSTGSNQNPGLMLRGGQTPTNPNTADILVWGAQAEAVTYQTTPSTYVATTASAYYGPRFEYDPVTLVPRGLLIEEARTNLLTYSEDLGNAAWTKDRVNVSTNSTLAPDGTNTADKVTDTLGGLNTYRIYNSLTLSAISYTQTFFAKAAEYSWCYVRIGTASRAWFNLSTGTVGTVDSPLTASISNVGNGWYRISCTIPTATAGSGFGLIGLTTGNGVEAYTPTTGGMGIFVWGAQLEAGAFATSYLPTGASTAARSADVASMSGTNFTSWFSAAQGTFAASFDFVGNADGANPRRIFQVQSDGVYATGYFSLHYQSGRKSLVNTSSSSGANTTVDWILTTTANISERVALSYDSSGLAFSYAGVSALTSATVFAGGANSTYFTIGNTNNLSQFLNGHIAYIRYYNLRLPNADLQALTSPPLTPSMLMTFDNSSNSYIVSNWWS